VFAKELAHGADAFVNDAFGVCHRNQGSVTGVCNHVATSYMGLLVKAELQSMVAALDDPKRSALLSHKCRSVRCSNIASRKGYPVKTKTIFNLNVSFSEAST
jgi:Phosphoglycerate kinase